MNRNQKAGRDEDMLPEYDFTGAVRGKYFERYHQGSNVILLDPDVAAVFRDSLSVNRALRELVAVADASVPGRRTQRAAPVDARAANDAAQGRQSARGTLTHNSKKTKAPAREAQNSELRVVPPWAGPGLRLSAACRVRPSGCPGFPTGPMCRDAAQHAFRTDVLVDIRPVNAVAIADQLPVRPLRWCRV